MAAIPNLPGDLVTTLDRRHPAWKWRLEAIVRDVSAHNQWKVLEEFDLAKKHAAVNARKSAVLKYGNSPSVSGFDFATRTDGGKVLFACKYTPEAIIEGEAEKWWVKRQQKMKRNKRSFG